MGSTSSTINDLVSDIEKAQTLQEKTRAAGILWAQSSTYLHKKLIKSENVDSNELPTEMSHQILLRRMQIITDISESDHSNMLPQEKDDLANLLEYLFRTYALFISCDAKRPGRAEKELPENIPKNAVCLAKIPPHDFVSSTLPKILLKWIDDGVEKQKSYFEDWCIVFIYSIFMTLRKTERVAMEADLSLKVQSVNDELRSQLNAFVSEELIFALRKCCGFLTAPGVGQPEQHRISKALEILLTNSDKAIKLFTIADSTFLHDFIPLYFDPTARNKPLITSVKSVFTNNVIKILQDKRIEIICNDLQKALIKAIDESGDGKNNSNSDHQSDLTNEKEIYKLMFEIHFKVRNQPLCQKQFRSGTPLKLILEVLYNHCKTDDAVRHALETLDIASFTDKVGDSWQYSEIFDVEKLKKIRKEYVTEEDTDEIIERCIEVAECEIQNAKDDKKTRDPYSRY